MLMVNNRIIRVLSEKNCPEAGRTVPSSAWIGSEVRSLDVTPAASEHQQGIPPKRGLSPKPGCAEFFSGQALRAETPRRLVALSQLAFVTVPSVRAFCPTVRI